jgi:hypothetical protein
MDEAVTQYIEKQPSPQKEILQRLRQIILNEFPDIKEQMKWGAPAYNGGACYLLGLKDHVNIGFALDKLPAEESAGLDGSGKTMKHIAISSADDVDESRIIRLLHLVE